MAQRERIRTNTEAPDEVGRFLNAAGREALLTAEDEVALAREIEAGKQAAERLASGRIRSTRTAERLRAAGRRGEIARERFIKANLRLVISVAKRYQGQGLPLLDLVQEGTIGLMRAVELFDWRRGLKFSTYATWWIRQAITRAVADRGRMIRIPVHVGDRLRKVRSIVRRLEQETGEEPTVEAVAKELRATPEEVAHLLEVDPGEPVSLDAPLGDDLDLSELVADDDDGPEDVAIEGLTREVVADAVRDLLTDQERRVLSLRFGLDGGGARTLREAARSLGVSAERIRQVERRALERLRDSEALRADAA